MIERMREVEEREREDERSEAGGRRKQLEVEKVSQPVVLL